MSNNINISMADYGTSFIGGFLLSVFGNFSWVWSLQVFPVTREEAVMVAAGFAFKILATLILGIIGGLAGLFGKDLYELFKRKMK